jgi:phytoene/squalene synthetase
LDRFAGSRDALASGHASTAFRDCLAFEVARTRERFTSGLGLADMVEGRLRREVRLFAYGGLAILDRIESHDYDVLAHRPRLGRGDLARLVWKELWR